MQLIDQFKGFCSTSSVFPENESFGFTPFEFPEINLDEKLQADLEKIVHPRNSILGKRMESFFEIAIRNSERYKLIASNIQIIEEKQTLGEIDFLLYDQMKDIPLHVELVYKLYIYDPAFASEIERWIGPNRKDSFSEKLKKLQQRQFPLLYKSETQKYLKELRLNSEEIEQQLCFKARLFLQDNEDISTLSINPDCIQGNWYKFSEFLEKPRENNLFHTPKKNNWSNRPETNENWMNYDEILETMKALFEKEKSPLIWMKTENSFKSFFVVWW